MHEDLETASAQVHALVHRSPRLCGLPQSHWRLQDVRAQLSWLNECTLAGVSQVLHRLRVHYKQGRASVHSPDLAYELKLARIRQARWRAQQEPDRFVFLYEDEGTY